jgi:hypothetical protein
VDIPVAHQNRQEDFRNLRVVHRTRLEEEGNRGVGIHLRAVRQQERLQEVRRRVIAHTVAAPQVEHNPVAPVERRTWVVAALRKVAPVAAVFRKVVVVRVVPEVEHIRGVNRQVENHREDSHLDYLDLEEERRLSWSYQTKPSLL